VSDYEKTLDDYRAEISALEARARTLRQSWVSADYEADRREADRLEAEASELRVLLTTIMRVTFGSDGEDEFEVGESSEEDESS
jgi:transcription elongation GreA/GreB family factor